MSDRNHGWRELHTHKPFMSRGLILSHISVGDAHSPTEVFCIHGVNEDPDEAEEHYEVKETSAIASVVQDIFAAQKEKEKTAYLAQLITASNGLDGDIVCGADLPTWALPYVGTTLFARVCRRTGSALSQAAAELKAGQERAAQLNNKLNESKQEAAKLRGEIGVALHSQRRAEAEAKALRDTNTSLQDDLNARETELRELKIRLASLAEPRTGTKDSEPKKATRHSETEKEPEEKSCVLEDSLTNLWEKLPEKLRRSFFPPMFGTKKYESAEKKVATPPKNAHQPKPVKGWGVFDKTLDSVFDTIEKGLASAFKGMDKIFDDPFFNGKNKKRK